MSYRLDVGLALPACSLWRTASDYVSSTGGILALGLGTKNWTVEHCTKLFRRLVDKAFTPRFLVGTSFGRPTYRASPLEEALAECFGDEPMFGGTPEKLSACTTKVAVTAATETGDKAVIFTNYNRVDDSDGRCPSWR